MFTLVNAENKVTLGCEIVGYVFPENDQDEWLLLRVKVVQGDKIFERIDAALETTELVDLCQWFTSLSEHRLPRYAQLDFTEPCIRLSFLACKDNRVRISIALSHELKPDFELEQFKEIHREWDVIFELTGNDFEHIIHGIKAAIQHYPMRGKHEDRKREYAHLSEGSLHEESPSGA